MSWNGQIGGKPARYPEHIERIADALTESFGEEWREAAFIGEAQAVLPVVSCDADLQERIERLIARNSGNEVADDACPDCILHPGLDRSSEAPRGSCRSCGGTARRSALAAV